MGAKPVNRRSFLKLGAAATGAAIGKTAIAGEPVEPPPREHLRYRPLGRTGLHVSEVSFGSFGFRKPTLLYTALDEGINLICTSADFEEGAVEKRIGAVLSDIGSRRDDLVVLTGTKIRRTDTKRDILDAIDGSLRRLRVDHVDVFKTHDVESPEVLLHDELFEAFDSAKRTGKVGHLALSGHTGSMQTVLNAALEDGRFEVFQIKYDFASYLFAYDILLRAVRKGIGTIAFKTHAGYRQDEINDLEAEGWSFQQATVKWALGHPAVASVCVDVSSFASMDELLSASGAELTDAETAMLERYRNEMYDRYCRFCRSCEVSCPHGVSIADVNRFAMYFKYYGREKDSMQLYSNLGEHRGAAACAGCSGLCEGGCPFGRRIHPELVEAHENLSFRKT
jgi:predicted aldo/keto reductase-like oxidoreductase